MDIQQLISSQTSFFQSQNTKSLEFRVKQLKKLKRLLKENENELHEAIYKDFKRSVFENQLTELTLIYHEINFAIKNLYRWAKKERVGTDILNFPAMSYIIK